MKRERYFQPKLGWRILWFLLPDNDRESLVGDFDEIFREKIKDKGKLAAMFWYWSQVILLISSSLKESIYWSVLMFRNNLKIAFRNLIRHKGFSFLNIT